MQSKRSESSPPEKNPGYKDLSVLSPLSQLSGWEPYIVFTVLAVAGFGFLYSGLVGQLGGAGAGFAVLSAACVVERLVHPFVLWLMGWHVYAGIAGFGGRHTADQVLKIYALGGQLSLEQHKVLEQARLAFEAKSMARESDLNR